LTFSSVAINTGRAYGFYIMRTGSSISRNLRYAEATATIPRCVSESLIIDCVAGDTISINAYAGVAIVCNGGRDWNTLTIQKIA